MALETGKPPWAKDDDEDEDAREADDALEARGVDDGARQPRGSESSPKAEGGQQADGETAKPRKKRKAKRRKRPDYVGSVATALHEGQREASIVAWLEKRGLGQDEIERTLRIARKRLGEDQIYAQEDDAHALHEQKKRHRLVGGLWLAGGLVFTLVTYTSASVEGGSYVLAWGPMAYGLFRLVRGL